MLISPIDIVSKSIDLYKTNRDFIFKYVWYMFLLSAGIILLGAAAEFAPESLGVVTIIVLVLGVIALSIGSLWINIGLIRGLATLYIGKKPQEPKKELENAKYLIWPTIVASLLAGLAIFAGMLLLIIPGLIFMLWFAFVVYAVALDDKKPTEALRASKELVKGRWWKTFWRLLVPGIIFGLLAILIQAVIEVPAEILIESMGEDSLGGQMVLFVAGLLITAGAVLITPFSAAAQTILYIELKRNPVATPEKTPAKKAA